MRMCEVAFEWYRSFLIKIFISYRIQTKVQPRHLYYILCIETSVRIYINTYLGKSVSSLIVGILLFL